jgi:FAD/FMN-containing dehydrogenase
MLTVYQTIELRQHFPKQVFEETDPAYPSLRDSYWSGNQKTVRPRCFFQPHDADQLARAVSICAQAKCKFGVKSGGHGHFAGQSCVEGGLQFDLAKLNSISISWSTGTAFVGTGCRWNAVYETLEKEGLMAIGGRAASVGVGGFLLGGE